MKAKTRTRSKAASASKRPPGVMPLRPIRLPNGELLLTFKEGDPGVTVTRCTDLAELMREPTPEEIARMGPADIPPGYKIARGRLVPIAKRKK